MVWTDYCSCKGQLQLLVNCSFDYYVMFLINENKSLVHTNWFPFHKILTIITAN